MKTHNHYYRFISCLTLVLFCLFLLPLSTPIHGQAVKLVNFKGGNWFLLGVNLPWVDWGCDFGSGCSNGVSVRSSSTQTRLRSEFQKMKANNVKTVRWWLFPGEPLTNDRGNTMIITQSQGGQIVPSSIHEGVYQDISSALQLAEEFDLYYVFTFFSSPDDIPSSWVSNTDLRQKTADTLGLLFERFKDHPRILAWELFNEPEFASSVGHFTPDDVNNPSQSALNVKDLTRRVISVQRSKTNTLVTIGPAWITMQFWKDLDVDFFSPHYYSNMTEQHRNALGTTADALRSQFGINQPIVLGEVYLGSGPVPDQQFETRQIDPTARYNDILNRGYAGTWAWSLLSDKTNDKLTVDLGVAGAFATRNSSIVGPKSSGTTVTISPPRVTTTIIPSVSPINPTGGCTQKSRGDADCDNKITLLDFEIWRREITGALATKLADFDGKDGVTLIDFTIWRGTIVGSVPSVSPSLPITTTVAPTGVPNPPGTVLTVPPSSVGKLFELTPVGTQLLDDATCRARVRRTTWEPVSSNASFNTYIPILGTDFQYASDANIFERRLTGNMTGKTDEIIQWASCKWGFDENVARAIALIESGWEQSSTNPDLVGITQVRESLYSSYFPASRKSSAFNVEFALADMRACYEGLYTWLGDGYAKGDMWGCIGRWNSGNWHDTEAESYISRVKDESTKKTWEQWK